MKGLEEILNEAAMREAEEIKRFLARSRSERRYRAILKIVAEGKTKWSEIKRSLEFLERHRDR